MAERRVRVTTEVGILARPATEFVDTAAESPAEVSIAKPGEQPFDAKSILQVLSLDVRTGSEIILVSDDEAVLDRLVSLVSGELDEHEADIEVGDVDDEE